MNNDHNRPVLRKLPTRQQKPAPKRRRMSSVTKRRLFYIGEMLGISLGITILCGLVILAASMIDFQLLQHSWQKNIAVHNVPVTSEVRDMGYGWVSQRLEGNALLIKLSDRKTIVLRNKDEVDLDKGHTLTLDNLKYVGPYEYTDKLGRSSRLRSYIQLTPQEAQRERDAIDSAK